jgi:hypothetical protein
LLRKWAGYVDFNFFLFKNWNLLLHRSRLSVLLFQSISTLIAMMTML